MTNEYLLRLRELLDKHGILFVADEVQSGCGRTGPVWAIEHFDVQPDLLVAGKTLGGGLPLAAVTGDSDVMDAPGQGGLGGTFGGNPLSCAAAMVVLDQLPGLRERAGRSERASANASSRSLRRAPTCAASARCSPSSSRPQRRGDCAHHDNCAGARARASLLRIYGNVIRLLPPLTITDDELARGLDILEACLVS
jgi:4-aminobutyrate aminotransferase-like enzyme